MNHITSHFIDVSGRYGVSIGPTYESGTRSVGRRK